MRDGGESGDLTNLRRAAEQPVCRGDGESFITYGGERMTAWGPGQKKLDDGHVMSVHKSFRLLTGDTVHWAECTDGWVGKRYIDYNDAEKDFGEHHGKQHKS